MSTPNPFSGAGDLSTMQSLTSNLSSTSDQLLSSFDLGNLSGSSSGSSSGGLWSDFSSLLGGVGSDITGALSSPLGETAAYGGLMAYGLNEASQAQKQDQGYANQVESASRPFLTAGQQLLKDYQSGTLPSYVTKAVQFDTQEGQNIIQSGQAMQNIASQNLALYSSGKLKPADQLQLDQQVAAEKAQVESKLGTGGAIDSSVALAYSQQIDNNAAITKQQILNSYFTTGNQAYNSWLTSTQEGAALMNQGTQFAQAAFAQEMNAALGLDQIGMNGLTTAIGLEIQSNTQLASEVSSLMSNMAAAYAYTMAGPGRAGSTSPGSSGSSSPGSGASSGSLTKGVSNLLSDVTGTSASSLAAQAASDYAPGAAAALASGPTLASTGSLTGNLGSELASTSSQLMSSLGFSSAGGAAAAGGAVAAAGAAPAALTAADMATVTSGLSSELASTSSQLMASDSAPLAASAGQEAGSSSGILGPALGAAGAAYGAYNLATNWQSGNTGTDTLDAAETGAGIGSMILPGIGTVVGGLIGGAVGAISSAFGGGRTDPETLNWNKVAGKLAANPSSASTLTAPQAYQLLAGVMDAKDNSPGHSEPIEQVFGRMGEGKLMVQMTNQINSAIKANPSLKNASASQLYSQVVAPWLSSKRASINPDQKTSSGAPEGKALPLVLTQLINLWKSGQLTSQSKVGVSGQTISGLQSFGNSAQNSSQTTTLLETMMGSSINPAKFTAMGMTI